MKNWHKSIFFFLGVIAVMSWMPAGFSEEDDESNQAEPQVGYEESTPITPKEEQAQVEATELPEALEVVPVQTSAQGAPTPAAQPEPLPPAMPAGEEIPGMEPTPSTAVPSGLLEIDGYKYPVYMFVPKDYQMDRTYAMIMVAPAESVTAQQQIEYFTGLAQRKSVFVLAPYVLWPKSGTTPYSLDEWFLSVKNDITQRFPINKKRIYLVGKGSGAQYAAYLAVKYPQEFGAVALLGEAWEGPFSRLVEPRSNASEQIPFYVALRTDGDARSRNQAWFDKLQQKGYPVHLVDYQAEGDLDQLDFKKSFFDWLEETSQSWAVTAASRQKSWKGKFKKGVKDFFAV